ncbi:unnamed protein product [Spodoptera exigua]|uniref:Exonuclease domain-containing protein n=1 Tax=Spodoptera exigua TaxID=7107 RepID=A0A922SBF0_SPOEX|nr:hypothetical protein HF086_003716 [Spodoptera exigua]CAH0663708.1 unnamed protein product [Spodoptera exigua]
MASSKSKLIKTYVFFDLETTGLMGFKEDVPSITELSMVAVDRIHFLNTPPYDVPRVQNRLLLCFNPEKKMSVESVELSRLNNALLETLSPFDKNSCDLIKLFISRLPKPVCLIAHNGLTFHFPILQHYMKLNAVELDADVMCTDSLYAFYDIFGMGHVKQTKTFNELIRLKYYQFEYKVKSEYKPSQPFKLQHIYAREVQWPLYDSSKSQCQTLQVLKIALKKAEKVIEWIDANHCKFSEVIVGENNQ